MMRYLIHSCFSVLDRGEGGEWGDRCVYVNGLSISFLFDGLRYLCDKVSGQTLIL